MKNDIKRSKDIDGEDMLSITVGDMTVFASRDISRWMINFGLTSELDGCEWMDTLTGRGAFTTIRAIRVAVSTLISTIESLGDQWGVATDSRRAKLYSRYISVSKIQVIT